MQKNNQSIEPRHDADLNHPSAEDWMEYLYDEASSKKRQTLLAHAETCDPCRTKLADWQSTKALLNEGILQPTHLRGARISGILKWAAAFAILACGIYGSVKGTVNSRQITEMRGSLEQSVRASLEPQIKTKLAAEHLEAMETLRTEIAKARENTLVAARTNDHQLLESITRITARARSEDREFLINALQQLEEKRSNELAALRNELETVAVLTEASFKKAQQQIVQLASFSSENEPSAKYTH